MFAARGVPDRYGGRLCGCAWTKIALKHILATRNLHWRGNFGQRCGGVVLHARAQDHAQLRAGAHVWFVLPHSLVWKSRRQGALATGRARLSWGVCHQIVGSRILQRHYGYRPARPYSDERKPPLWRQRRGVYPGEWQNKPGGANRPWSLKRVYYSRVERFFEKLEPTKPPQKRHWQVAFEPTKNIAKSPFRNSLNSGSYLRYSCESCSCSIEHNFQKTGDLKPGQTRNRPFSAQSSYLSHISAHPDRPGVYSNAPLSVAELGKWKWVKVFGKIVTSALNFSLTRGCDTQGRLLWIALGKKRQNSAREPGTSRRRSAPPPFPSW